MFQALIFDMDGTLVDSEKLHYTAWKKALQHYGVEDFSFASFLPYVGVSNEKLAEDYIAHHSLKTDSSEILQTKQQLYLRMIPEIELLPGVRDILERYHGRLALAIGSSSDAIELHSILETKGLSHFFDHIVGGDEVEMKKPAPDIYQRAGKLLAVPSHDCLVFEDSESGIAAAKAAGMAGIAIPNQMAKQMDLSQADHILERIDQADDAILMELHDRLVSSSRDTMSEGPV